MAHRLKNLSGIPLDVPTLEGPRILPARGEITANLSAYEAEVMKHSPYVEISGSEAVFKPLPDASDEVKTSHPLDHDNDGHPGGSLPAAERGLDDLRTQYEELFGEAPDGRWGEKRLSDAIDAKLAE